MTKFDSIINRLLLEAKLDDSLGELDDSLGDNPDESSPDGEGSQPPPEGGEDGGEQPDMDSPEETITSPEEFELAKLAVRALFFDPQAKKVNPKIYDDFETNKNVIDILGYVERLINSSESDEGFRVKEKLGDANLDDSGAELEGKSIGQKLKYFNKNQKDNKLDHGRRIFWTRIILNTLKYNGNNYNLIEDDITPDTIKNIFDKLKGDFNHDTRGVFKSFDSNTSAQGPGVF